MGNSVIEAHVFKGSKGGKVVKSTSKQELAPGHVAIKIKCSGMCGTDVHYASQDMVLGHEGVGVISDVGEGCTLLKKGDRVGYGYEHYACGICQMCTSGREEYCPKREMYGLANLDRGAFSSHVVVDEKWVFRLPDSLSFEDAAPLQCAGITVFGAMMKYGVGPTSRVGIVGLGGLGHLAVQFARKMGSDVVVFSHSDKKRKEAFELGANEYVVGKPKNIKPVDFVIVTASVAVEWGDYFEVLSPTATIIPLTVAQGDMSHPYFPMVVQGFKIGGSVIGPRYLHNLMLEFAARNNVKPIIEKVEMNEASLNKAMERLSKSDVRYRFVAMAPEDWN